MSEITFPKDATFKDLLGPAMEITDQDEADRYFDALVRYNVEVWGKSPEESASIQRSNLGYYAGYYDSETRAPVERLFHCAHPVFGAVAERGVPTAEEAFEAGRRLAAGKPHADNGTPIEEAPTE